MVNVEKVSWPLPEPTKTCFGKLGVENSYEIIPL